MYDIVEKTIVDIIKYNTYKEKLHNQINLSKNIFLKLCSSLKMKAQLITWAEQPPSGHNIL